MCSDCEKSLPNQIVFNKIESIIRLMQDEQIGLPVKTAKSFMSKIPSVFTGTDLVQWIAKNLKLEDQQEAVHLANLIASHGYIFPIEDHTLSIKNDCTFYRFQTPCLWPSNNVEPENTDYAVYLCKRTMQGKTRLELADYEAENLARLQKMFSRKWEFIFMQAESQAKVDKKRDKLERKVLDSQERAFWDVYRPVPGCVNTTELDIKKACRLSKSAKRCAECQKLTAVASGQPVGVSAPASAPDGAPAQPALAGLGSPLPARAVQVLAEEPERAAEAAAAEEEPAELAVGEELKETVRLVEAAEVKEEEEAEPKETETEPTSEPTGGLGGQTEEATKQQLAASKASKSGAHPHRHYHHHHHHHHHHPHHHHHHHRQCPHHKQREQQKEQQQQQSKDQQLSIPTESIATAALAASAGWTGAEEPSDRPKLSEEPAGAAPKSAPACPSRRRQASQFMRAPSEQSAVGVRRKSECNRMMSVAEPLESCDLQPPIQELQPGKQQLVGLADRPASACSSLGGDAQVLAITRQTRLSASAGSQQMLRKSSLNIPSAVDERAPGRKSSISVVNPQRPTLQGTQSVCMGAVVSAPSSSTSDLANHERLQPPDSQANIGDLERELEALKVRLDRRMGVGGVKMSKVTQSYLSYFKQWAEYDPFISQPIPSNPWISDSTELWDSERQTKDVHCRRVRRWAFSLKELLNDPAGREQFYKFLEKEFSAENLKFWDAVQELKRVQARDVARRVEAIWIEYLAQDANCPINIDSKSYETSKRNMAKNKNNRYIFDEAAGHVYQLMKNDSYPRYLRSDMYKDYKEASEKKRFNQVAFDVFKPQITTLKNKFNFN